MLGAAMQSFYAFTLVLIRMGGLMTIGPVFGQSVVPANIRILLVLSVSILITPTLSNHASIAFRRLDNNQDNRLSRDEVPPQLQNRFDSLLVRAGKNHDSSLDPSEFYYDLKMPRTILDYAWIGIGEFALGLVLGLGVLIVLSGLQLAGELFDQQTGTALGEIANPGLDINGSVTGQFFFMMGVAMMLVMEPTGAHLLMMSALIETFQTLPVGEAYISVDVIELLRDLVHQSLVMGVQVAAPLLAAMSLVALTMGFIGHTVPQINVLIIGFPIRAMISLLVLSLSLSGIGRAVVDIVPATIDSLRAALTGM